MANWKYKLKVSEDRKLFAEGQITIVELAKRFAAKLRAIGKSEENEEPTDIAYDFEVLVTDEESFDEALERLYYWADTALDDNWPRTRMCWVEP